MTPEEKAVIDAAMEWRNAILGDPTGGDFVMRSLEILGSATYALSTACLQCNRGGHVCPGDGQPIGHTASDCGRHEDDKPIPRLDVPASTASVNEVLPPFAYAHPCWECLAGIEDPRPWCDCRTDETCLGPCRNRAHDKGRCPNAPEDCSNSPPAVPPRPTEEEYGSLPILNIEILKTAPVRPGDPS